MQNQQQRARKIPNWIREKPLKMLESSDSNQEHIYRIELCVVVFLCVYIEYIHQTWKLDDGLTVPYRLAMFTEWKRKKTSTIVQHTANAFTGWTNSFNVIHPDLVERVVEFFTLLYTNWELKIWLCHNPLECASAWAW